MTIPFEHNPSIHDPDALRFAIGRKKYNSVRRARAGLRRRELLEMAREGVGCGLTSWGFQSEAARRFGVNRSTISRDIRAIVGAWARLDVEREVERRVVETIGRE